VDTHRGGPAATQRVRRRGGRPDAAPSRARSDGAVYVPVMDVNYPAEAAEFRAQVRSFLDDNLPSDWVGLGALDGPERQQFLKQWRETLAEQGYLAINWPEEYGGAGLSPLETVILHEEFTARGAPTGGANDGFSIGMLGNTLLVWGTEEQKRRFLPRILDGTDVWCQGYSEPDAGSDLANLGTRAERDGDEWVINGQKIWTSSGNAANWIFAVCRTNPDVPKHQGLSFLLVPMDQPGVELRPIRNIAGQDHFFEVFFTDARTPVDHVVGEINGGWAVTNTLLGFERGVSATTAPLRFRRELDDLLAICRDRGLHTDPVVRQELARFHTKVELMRFAGYRALTRFLAGDNPGPESSIGKVFWSEYHREVTEAALRYLGPDGQVGFGDTTAGGLQVAEMGTANNAGRWIHTFLAARPGTIYAGTSEIQRNIIGERVLGLPKEPRADAGPWSKR
jgi:alkylation response protein AidB-like acyl-CoA dehydrogenase